MTRTSSSEMVFPGKGSAEPRRSLLWAMGFSGISSLWSGLLSAAATKLIAVLAGPAHLAMLATLQQIRQTALVAATGNGQIALIRGASALHGLDRREYLRTAAGIFAVLTSLVVLTLLALGLSAAGLAGGGSLGLGFESSLRPVGAVLWFILALVSSSLFVFLNALLAALGAVGRLAWLQLASPLAMLGGVAVAAPYLRRTVNATSVACLCAVLALSAATGALSATAALWPERQVLAIWFRGGGAKWSNAAAGQFFKTAGAMLASSLLASLVLLAVRTGITAHQGLSVTGQWDAAWNISMNQTALILSSLQSHYMPALARMKNPREYSHRICAVLTAGSLAAALVIAGIAWFKPEVIAMFYSKTFATSAEYLRWTLIGDYLKVGSWILSIPLLGSGRMSAFLAADVAAYGTFGLVARLLAGRTNAATAASLAFVLMYAVHLIFCATWLVRCQRVAFNRQTWAVWAGGFCLVLMASGLTWNRR